MEEISVILEYNENNICEVDWFVDVVLCSVQYGGEEMCVNIEFM